LYSPDGELYCPSDKWYYASHSYIACGSLIGEYNITKAGRLSFHFPKGKYHFGQSPEYHFCPWAQRASDFVTKTPYESFLG
ncbi:MAG: hypothetical protein U0N38_10115, partial [Acutalibacteraceae bacterium]